MSNRRIDPQSRDYKLSDIERDERFAQTSKEAIITTLVVLAHTAFCVVNLFLGCPGVEKYTFVLGLPKWFFIQLVEFVVYIVVSVAITKYCYKDMDITAIGGLRTDKP